MENARAEQKKMNEESNITQSMFRSDDPEHIIYALLTFDGWQGVFFLYSVWKSGML